MAIEYRKIEEINDGDLADLKPLYSQLSSRGLKDSLDGILRNPDAIVYGAYDGEKIIGIAGLYLVCTPMLTKGLVEEVVVDEGYRGQGIGKKIMNKLVEAAKELKIDYIDLTSRPDKVAANRLYQSLGFEQRETNVYRLNL